NFNKQYPSSANTPSSDRYRIIIQVLSERQTGAFRCSDTRYRIGLPNKSIYCQHWCSLPWCLRNYDAYCLRVPSPVSSTREITIVFSTTYTCVEDTATVNLLDV